MQNTPEDNNINFNEEGQNELDATGVSLTEETPVEGDSFIEANDEQIEEQPISERGEDLNPPEVRVEDREMSKRGVVTLPSGVSRGLSKGKPASIATISSLAQRAKGDNETIRIVIKDVKPPIVARILQFSMRIICFVLLVAVCGIGIPRLFGVNEFNVLTGSMSPTYPIGTLVFVQPKDPNSIRPGEVVSCVMNERLDIITHRCVANNYTNKTITTRGDANNADDAPTLYENVVGVVIFSVPYVGGAVDYLTNDETGRIVGIGILLFILALTFLAEAICSFLTKQNANVYNSKNAKPSNVIEPKSVIKKTSTIDAVDKTTGDPLPSKSIKKRKLF